MPCKMVSIHKAPHLLFCRALEVQKIRKACPVPCICGTFVNAYSSVFLQPIGHFNPVNGYVK